MVIALQGSPAWARDVRIGHYGGAIDKEDCQTEAVPHAYVWYAELEAMGGSAYRTDGPQRLVHCERIAIARSEAARTRAAEKVWSNAVPITADERLEYWVTVLDVPTTAGDTRQELRVRCGARWQSSEGNDALSVDAAVAKLLGENLVAVHRTRGADLATPPTLTMWPGINPGPSTYDVSGDGAWLSERGHLVVEVQRLQGQTEAQFLELMSVHLFDLLDKLLPGHMTFNWTVGTSFVLDVSQLDFTGMS